MQQGQLSVFEIEAVLQLQMQELVTARRSFVIETNLAAERDYTLLKGLKAQGYCIELRYISLESVALCKQRVAERVQKGGHDVPPALVEQRYANGLSLLKRQYQLFDRMELYDNTEAFTLMLLKNAGEPLQLVASELLPWARAVANHVERMDSIYRRQQP